jgi:hypothetical protein
LSPNRISLLRSGLVLADASALCAIARIGRARWLLDWFGVRLGVVRDVYQELLRRSDPNESANYITWFEATRGLFELSPPGKIWVARVGISIGADPIGILATARMAQELQSQGKPTIVLADAKLSGQICHHLRVPAVQSREVLLKRTVLGL